MNSTKTTSFGGITTKPSSAPSSASTFSPPSTTAKNHLFASLCGYIELDLLQTTTALNHFALKMKLYLQATQVAFAALRQLQPVRLAA